MTSTVRRPRRGMWPFVLLSVFCVLAISIPTVVGQGTDAQGPATEFVVVELTPIARPLHLVTDFEFTPDGRILVTEKYGRIRVVQPNGDINGQLFLDLSGQVSIQGEQGLVSIALHPDFDQNGFFYVNYTDRSEPNQISRVVRYRVSDADPDVADPASAFPILSVTQPSPIHNGAELVFGPDGYLYAGFGDGGRYGDPNNNGQNGQTLLGAILRIDVDNPDGGKAYGIPADNPFVGDAEVVDELWAMGLRNPWRFSFDKLNGDMYIGDVGGDRYEEINLERGASAGGFNYGWRCYEGYVENVLDGCQDRAAYDFPIFVLAHPEIDPSAGSICAVIGGMVHRGDPQSPFYGHYFFGDYCSGALWAIKEVQPDQWQVVYTAVAPQGYVSAFGQDASGELYVADLGTIYRISPRIVSTFPGAYLPLTAAGAGP